MSYTEKAPDIRVTGEASSLTIEWSHDVCRFLLKWLPGLELKKHLKSSQVSTEGKRASAKQLGMYTECNGSSQFVTCPLLFTCRYFWPWSCAMTCLWDKSSKQ